MNNYAGIDDQYASFEKAEILLRSIPFDGTSTWGKGADNGFKAFLDASENMELYDIETNSEVYKKGIYLTKELSGFSTAEEMVETVYQDTKKQLKTNRFLTTFGGEHSISIGAIKAFYERFENLTVLQIDAHADLRSQYLGTPYNHACAVYDASRNCNLVQAGIRSMDVEEVQHIQEGNMFYMHTIRANEKGWMQQALERCTDNVYITFDLDAFDPAVCPGTGTPEPGGFFWYEILSFLKQVFSTTNVVGFDIVELAPMKGNRISEFLAAKLYFKLLTYKFFS